MSLLDAPMWAKLVVFVVVLLFALGFTEFLIRWRL